MPKPLDVDLTPHTGLVLPGQVPTYLDLGPRLHGYGGHRLRLLVLMLRWYVSLISALLYTVLFFTSDPKRRPTAVMRFTAMTEITIVWATV